MAEPTKAAETKPEVKPSEPKPIERSFVEDYLTQLREKIFGEKYLGKTGYNPYVWWKDKGLQELERRFNAGQTEQSLYKAILAVQFSEPTVENPAELPARKGTTPVGIKYAS